MELYLPFLFYWEKKIQAIWHRYSHQTFQCSDMFPSRTLLWLNTSLICFSPEVYGLGRYRLGAKKHRLKFSRLHRTSLIKVALTVTINI